MDCATISPPTSCCENAISSLVPASCFLVLFQRFAERRRPGWRSARSSGGSSRGFGPARPSGSSALDGSAPWRISTSSFVHHEDVRRANRHGRRSLTPAMDAALWRNVRRGSRYLSRRLRGAGLEIEWAGTDERVTVRPGEPTARLSGPPGELLLYRLWAPGCRAGRGRWNTGGGCGGAPHALRHVNPSLASVHRS